MREIKVKVNFEKGTIQKESAKIVSGDYNSTKLVFEFDREDGIKTLEMNDTEDNLLYNGEIVNNEVILVGEDEEGNPCSLFAEEGTYPFEVVLYDGESKLTAVGGKLKITAENVAISDTIVTPQLPVFDQLLGQVSTALNNCEEAVEDIYNAEEEAEGIISDFESNVENYTAAFNTNATNKTNDFNTNASTKTQAVNQIYEDTQDLVDGFDTKVTQAKNELNGIVSDAQEVYDDFETNAAAKTTAFNDNAASKTETFNTNASEKTSAFNTNAAAKTAYFDSHADSIEKELASLKTTRNAIPKVSGEGTEVTLDRTAEATFEKVGLMGNCEQETTSGKNLTDTTTFIGTVASSSRKDITIVNIFEGGTYSLVTNVQCSLVFRNANDENILNVSSGNFNVGETKITSFNISSEIANNISKISVYPYGDSFVNIVKWNNLMICSGTVTDASYEPYTGGIASPNPDYPQDIHVVSGDNEISVVGKNLFDVSTIEVGLINSSGVSSSVSAWRKSDFIEVLPNTTYNLSWMSSDSFFQTIFVEYDNNKSYIRGNDNVHSNTYSANYTTGNNTKYIKFSYSIRVGGTDVARNDIQLEQGSQATSYEPHKEQTKHITLPNGMELAGIGDYRDEFRRSTGKNLFDKDSLLNGHYNNQGVFTNSTYWKTIMIDVEDETNMAISGITGSADASAKYWTFDKNMNPISSIGNYGYSSLSFSNAKYVNVTILASEINNNIQVELGTAQSTDYEPYGVGVWYKYGVIGKVVLDGSEVWHLAERDTSKNGVFYLENFLTTYPFIRENSYSNYGVYYTGFSNRVGRFDIHYNQLRFYAYSMEATVDDWKAKLASKNLVFEGVKATPTYETITDTTLISQLDDIYYTMMSYKGQTNISQTNNDAPFYLNVEALYDLEDLLTRVSALEG